MVITINNKNINYEIKGKGTPILFVHGWGGSIHSLEKLSDLVSVDHQAIILDLAGFGQSDNPDPNWGVKEYSELLYNFISSLNLKHVSYFGHSYGGSLGIYLSSHYPEAIDKLILCDASYKRVGKVSKSAKLFNKVFQFLPLPYKFKFLIKKIIYKIFFPNSDLIKFPHLESTFKKIMTEDLTPYLDKINQPTLIIWGEKDIDTPITYAHELNQKIKDSKLKIFPDETHSLPLKQPELVYKEIQKFI